MICAGKASQKSPPVQTADVLKHLGDSLNTQWRRYRKRLKRCQERFSEDAVHDVRVEARRLLSTIELLGAFIPERDIKKVRRALKRHLDTFDQLRDTQVQLGYVGRMAGTFPDAHAFYDWLRNREARFTRETRKAVKRIRTKRLGRRLAAFEKEIRRQRKQVTRERAFVMVRRAMNQAFARVAQLCLRVRADDTRTIHRTRIAFKRFRYMIEALSPLLPAVTEEHRRAMRGYQCMMGDIQDMEVLLAALDKFVQKERVNAASARRLKKELVRWRQMLIQIFLNAAGRLRRFWPPPGFRHADATGFALNTSNYRATEDLIRYGHDISGRVGGKYSSSTRPGTATARREMPRAKPLGATPMAARSAPRPRPTRAIHWWTRFSGSSRRANRTARATTARAPGAGGPSTRWGWPSGRSGETAGRCGRG